MRLGSSAGTTRGMKEDDFRVIGSIIADLLEAEAAGKADEIVDAAAKKVASLAEVFPIYNR